MPQSRRSAGFTLIELMIAVTVVAMLATIALPVTELAVQHNREEALHTALRQLRDAIDAYKQAADEGRVAKAADGSGYPPSLDVLAAGVADLKTPDKRKIYFLRGIPRDPMATDPGVAAADTWGLRSYQSPPDAPAEGDDVYDVHSLSGGIGLNGVPYRQW